MQLGMLAQACCKRGHPHVAGAQITDEILLLAFGQGVHDQLAPAHVHIQTRFQEEKLRGGLQVEIVVQRDQGKAQAADLAICRSLLP